MSGRGPLILLSEAEGWALNEGHYKIWNHISKWRQEFHQLCEGVPYHDGHECLYTKILCDSSTLMASVPPANLRWTGHCSWFRQFSDSAPKNGALLCKFHEILHPQTTKLWCRLAVHIRVQQFRVQPVYIYASFPIRQATLNTEYCQQLIAESIFLCQSLKCLGCRCSFKKYCKLAVTF